MAARFFIEKTLVSGQCLSLAAGPAHHISRVLRLRTGDAITVFNGAGGEYAAHIQKITKQSVQIVIGAHAPIDRLSTLPITLAQGIAKGQRMDYTIQKATELGVAMIVPLYTEFVNVRLGVDREALKHAHWRRISIAACEQCGRNRLPLIAQPTNLSDWLEQDTSSTRLVLHPAHGRAFSDLSLPAQLSLLIGPEGGFSAAEFTAACAHGWQAVTLGPRLLRTETATAAAVAVCQSLWGDLGYVSSE